MKVRTNVLEVKLDLKAAFVSEKKTHIFLFFFSLSDGHVHLITIVSLIER